MFGDRVNFDPQERRFYAYDVGTMPGMMKRFSGSNLPAGIVQPDSQDELVQLMRWAQENKIPLIPRGKATSGYGGAVPTRSGLVIESNRMKQILEIIVEERTVMVQAGVVWDKLEAEL
ncbi:MAG: FAD-binding oxidoreductase [Syntrophomonadaceae bacterium]